MADSHTFFLRVKAKFTILISFDVLIEKMRAIQLCITLFHVKKVMMARKVGRYTYMEYQMALRLFPD